MLRGASLQVNSEYDSAQAIKALTPLVRKLGPKANPANLKLLPPAAIAAWAFYIGKLPFRAIHDAFPAVVSPPAACSITG